MKLSLNWLSEQLDLSQYTPEQLSELLTFAGVEVEEINRKGVPSDLIVVAQIKEATQHPDADKLKVCQVDAGEPELRQIVCGAKNYAVGDKVPCALPGSDLGNGFVIHEGKLRGIESKGMLCGAVEIGLTDEEDGLMILPPDSVIGTPLTSLYPSNLIFDLEITPNRPDCLSHSGMARELGAIINQTPKHLSGLVAPEKTGSTNVQLVDYEGCPYFTKTLVKNVKVKPSPLWLVEKLEAIGLVPVNNIVDITNYVLHETGQPLHAYDASTVGEEIIIRPATEGETFLGLNGMNYTLHADDCLISNETNQILSLAGILGAESSRVTVTTSDIILEAAYFTPSRIRRSARRQGNLTTDSSYRFERGVDFEQIHNALGLALKLIKQEAKGASENTETVGELPASLPTVELPERLLHQVTGGDISMETAEKHLRSIGLIYIKNNRSIYWGIPAFRQDLTRPIDLIEEVVRLEGLDKISSRTQSHATVPSTEDLAYDGQLTLKRQLTAQGFYECSTIKLISAQEALDSLTIKPLLDGDLINVSLPLSEDLSTMRPSLTTGLLSSAARNARQGAKSMRFFETGRCFRNAGGGRAKDLESDHLGILISGIRTIKGWNSAEEVMDAFDLKGIISTLTPNDTIQLKPRERASFLLSAEIQLNGKTIGVFAQLHPQKQRALNFEFPVYLAELDITKILSAQQREKKAAELSKFPGSSRDVALEAPLAITAADLEAVIAKHNEPLLRNFICFDLFHDATGEQLSAEKKSFAYRMNYRSDEKSLKAKDVDKAHEHLVKTLCERLSLQQR